RVDRNIPINGGCLDRVARNSAAILERMNLRIEESARCYEDELVHTLALNTGLKKDDWQSFSEGRLTSSSMVLLENAMLDASTCSFVSLDSKFTRSFQGNNRS